MSPASTAIIESPNDAISNLRLNECRMETVEVTRVSFDGNTLDRAAQVFFITLAQIRVQVNVATEVHIHRLRL